MLRQLLLLCVTTTGCLIVFAEQKTVKRDFCSERGRVGIDQRREPFCTVASLVSTRTGN